MTALEIVIAGLLVVGGLRSLWVWGRRPFEGTDVRDHLLYAVFVTGRAGTWFAFAGLFAIYASSDARGRAVVDELAALRWFLLVPIVLTAMQVLARYFLARRGD